MAGKNRVFIKTHVGDWYWSPVGIIGESMQLKNIQRRVLEHYKSSSISLADGDLNIYVHGRDTLIDLIVVCAVALKGRKAKYRGFSTCSGWRGSKMNALQVCHVIITLIPGAF